MVQMLKQHGSVGYTIGAVALGALYGETKYGVK